MNPIDGRTLLAGVFGNPVAHTLSPAMHNAAFDHCGINARYLPFLIEPARLGEAVAGVRALGMLGVNVTVPFKQAVMDHLDEIDREARVIGAVNTVVNRDGRLTGCNTDGRGFVRSLREAGVAVEGKKILVVGAGGAARAVAASLLLANAAELALSNRTPEKAAALAEDLKALGPPVKTVPLGEPSAVAAADVVVQTTSLGLRSGDPFPLDPALFRKGQTVCDLVYHPETTRFLEAATARGATVVSGLGMLLWQGALAFELWTGREPPVEAMREGLRARLP